MRSLRSRVLCLLCLPLAVVACCSSSGGGADAGPDAGVAAADAGDGGFCTQEGQSCIAVNDCCDPTDSCSPAAGYVCAPIFATDAGPDGGSPDAGPDGGPDAGLGDGGPGDGGVDAGSPWRAEPVLGGLDVIVALSVPATGVPVAAGTGSGVGGVLARQGGASPSWLLASGTPPAAGLFGVWTDPAGDLFAAGQGDGGSAVLFGGSVDGGFALEPNGGAQILFSVFGLSAVEALAVGVDASGGAALALHLEPDGGLLLESLPQGIVRLLRVQGAATGGAIAALGADSQGSPQILSRADGGWTELPAPSGAKQLSDLAFGPAGDLLVVGDDGAGNGLAYRWTGGGFVPLDLSQLPGVPKLRAVLELAAGEIYLAAGGTDPNSFLSTTPEILHLVQGSWSIESLPPSALDVTSLGGGGAAGLFAAGRQTCQGCPSAPLILRRSP